MNVPEGVLEDPARHLHSGTTSGRRRSSTPTARRPSVPPAPRFGRDETFRAFSALPCSGRFYTAVGSTLAAGGLGGGRLDGRASPSSPGSESPSRTPFPTRRQRSPSTLTGRPPTCRRCAASTARAPTHGTRAGRHGDHAGRLRAVRDLRVRQPTRRTPSRAFRRPWPPAPRCACSTRPPASLGPGESGSWRSPARAMLGFLGRTAERLDETASSAPVMPATSTPTATSTTRAGPPSDQDRGECVPGRGRFTRACLPVKLSHRRPARRTARRGRGRLRAARRARHREDIRSAAAPPPAPHVLFLTIMRCP